MIEDSTSLDKLVDPIPQVPQFPDRITLELTNHCNLSCVMCPRQYMTGPKGYMSFSLYCRIVDQMAEHHETALVPFFRGESLLHPKCIEMLRYAKKMGIGPVQFTTNATLMTEKVARALLDLDLDFVSFSVDTIDPMSYGEIRLGAELKDVLNNIEYFCDLKNKRNLDKPEIQVSVVKTDNTSKTIGEFVRFWNKHVDRVRVYEAHSKDGNFGLLNKSREGFLGKRKPCMKPFSDTVIYWNGQVALCNHDWDRKKPLGDVGRRSILEIWHGEGYQRVRDGHLGKESLERLCQGCDHWEAYYMKENLIGELYTKETDGQTDAGIKNTHNKTPI